MRRTWAVRDRMPTKPLGGLASKSASNIYDGTWPEEQSPVFLQKALTDYDEKISRDNLLKDEIFRERMRGKVHFDASKAKEIFVSMLNRIAQTEGEKFTISSDLHIEHILPKTLPRVGWQAFETRGIHAACSQRLGNLMLLSRSDNKDADQMPYVNKLPIYKGSNYFKVSFLDGVDEWTPEAIEERQNRIVDKLCEIWKLES